MTKCVGGGVLYREKKLFIHDICWKLKKEILIWILVSIYCVREGENMGKKLTCVKEYIKKSGIVVRAHRRRSIRKKIK